MSKENDKLSSFLIPYKNKTLDLKDDKFYPSREADKFNFTYFKREYYTDLLYLYKIVHNKSLVEDEEIKRNKKINNDEFNNFCTFVWHIKNNHYKMKRTYVKLISMENSTTTKQINLNEKQINEIWYIFNFLKEYDYTEIFFKYLTFVKLENYLVSTLV